MVLSTSINSNMYMIFYRKPIFSTPNPHLLHWLPRFFSLPDGAPISNPTKYCELVGSLQYLTLTRLDISFAVNTVAQFMSAPRTSHLVAAKRILRYIKGTIDLGLTFTSQIAAARLSAYSDTNWAGCPYSRRLTIGYVITLGTNLISWCSKK
ncbi:uncharacterized protein LOC109949960 [Prunus persica]|uniref:uncharacterized protein LOC109949960 n=1 Tax=Prunus persica TaxID=3760 RepID=UPI0009AB9B9B|nr:uncharacterized protein LOC109949960 [Prunus persica]